MPILLHTYSATKLHIKYDESVIGNSLNSQHRKPDDKPFMIAISIILALGVLAMCVCPLICTTCCNRKRNKRSETQLPLHHVNGAPPVNTSTRPQRKTTRKGGDEDERSPFVARGRNVLDPKEPVGVYVRTGSVVVTSPVYRVESVGGGGGNVVGYSVNMSPSDERRVDERNLDIEGNGEEEAPPQYEWESVPVRGASTIAGMRR